MNQQGVKLRSCIHYDKAVSTPASQKSRWYNDQSQTGLWENAHTGHRNIGASHDYPSNHNCGE